MSTHSRPARVGEEIRQEVSQLLSRDVHDPGIGFVTVTRVTVSPDLQIARIYYTQMGDAAAKKATAKALARALPFLRRAIGQRIRLRRVPELVFHFDAGVEHQARIEKILFDLEEERRERSEGPKVPGSEGPMGDGAMGDGPMGEDDIDKEPS